MAVFELIMVIKNCKGQGQIVQDNLENLLITFVLVYIYIYSCITTYTCTICKLVLVSLIQQHTVLTKSTMFFSTLGM